MENTQRVQLDMLPKSLERLQALKSRTEAGSYAEVVRAALQLYEFAVDEVNAGGMMLLRSKDGVERELIGPVGA